MKYFKLNTCNKKLHNKYSVIIIDMYKTMRFCFVLSILLIVLAGCGDNSSQTDSTVLSVSVKGCAAQVSENTKSLTNGVPKAPEINVTGHTIIFSSALEHLCCRKVEITKVIQGNNIDIIEYWSGLGCKCECFSDIKAAIENVTSGKYIVTVYETGTDPFDQTKQIDKTIIITKEITIQDRQDSGLVTGRTIIITNGVPGALSGNPGSPIPPSPMADVVIYFKSDSGTYKVTSGSDGAYSIELPAGNYKIGWLYPGDQDSGVDPFANSKGLSPKVTEINVEAGKTYERELPVITMFVD